MDKRQKQPLHSRQTSASTVAPPKAEAASSKPSHPDGSTASFKSNTAGPHYTVFVRLPFPRNGFQDPPAVEWDASKDEALWKIISGSSGKDLNWEEIGERFQVSLPFLLQQAAWLYEQRFESMKAQMKRLGAGVGVSSSSSPVVAQGESISGIGIKDLPKPAAISTQKNSPLPPGDLTSSPGTPRSNRPMYSRTPSTNTVTQSRMLGSGSKPQSQVLYKTSDGSLRRRTRPSQTFEALRDDEDNLGHDGASEDESEEEPAASSRSQAFRRSQLTKKPVMASLSSDGDVEDDDEDDDSGGYLPFAAASKSSKSDPAATLRSSPVKPTVVPQQSSSAKGKSKEPPPDSSASSASSAQNPPASGGNRNVDANARQPVLSPRHRAELEKLSPRYKKSGSEGSPSMGSSFSDLDDASVTQSALDDAILSNMQHQSMGMTLGAGMGSRISGLRDALSRK